MDPQTRQSADHSMFFIVAHAIKNILKSGLQPTESLDHWWQKAILTPDNYGHEGLHDQEIRDLMAKITFAHEPS